MLRNKPAALQAISLKSLQQMQDNLEWQKNVPRDTIVAQNLKAPERSQESEIAENYTMLLPFFPLRQVSGQGNYSRLIS